MKMWRQSKSARKTVAFTLVELLVVIAIIAMLAALLFPAFGTVRQQVFTARCVHNQHITHQLIMRYAEDHDGDIIPNFYGDNPQYRGPGMGDNKYAYCASCCIGWWPFIVQDPGGDHKMYGDGACGGGGAISMLCCCYISNADATKIFARGDCPIVAARAFDIFGGTMYGVNGNICGNPCFNPVLPKISSVYHPGRLILIGDVGLGGVTIGGAGSLEYRHVKRAVVTFVDGHAQTISSNAAVNAVWGNTP